MSSELAPSHGDETPISIEPRIDPNLTPADEPTLTPSDQPKPSGDPAAEADKEEPSPLLEGEEGDGALKTPTAQRLPSLPKTSGQFSTDLFTGSASYVYAFDVPEGRAGLTPPLALRYSSARRTEFGSAGARGWDFEVGHIERTSRYGVDKIYTASSTFTFYPPGGGGSVELVPLELLDEIHGTYGAKVENDFSLITFATSNSWTIVDRNGVTWTYGTSTLSREYDPNDESHTSSWYVSDAVGPTGATMHYAYTKNGNVAYPVEVQYGGQMVGGVEEPGPFTVSFTWATVADGSESYSRGYFRSAHRRLMNTGVAVGGTLRQRYDVQAIAVGSDGISHQLTSVHETRYDPFGALASVPTTTFSYHQALPLTWSVTTTSSTQQDVIPGHFYDCVRQYSVYPYWQCGDPGTSVADINGDGRDDVIISDMYANNGGGGFPIASTVYFYQPDGSWVADHSYATSVEAIVPYEYRTWFAGGHYNFVDLNGDRLADVVMGDYAAGRVYINNGHGFDLAPYSTPIVPGKNRLFADINGDGLPDYVYSYSTSSESENPIASQASQVYLGTGNGWQLDASWTVPFSIDNCVWSQPEGCYVYGSIPPGRNEYRKYRLLDVNADGLLDAVFSWRINNHYPRAVFLNTGTGWIEASSTAWGSFPDWYTCGNFNECPPSWQGVVDSLDLSGDGGSDLIARTPSGQENMEILPGLPNQNRAVEPHYLPSVPAAPSNQGGQGLGMNVAATRFTDFNGDGQLDLSYGYHVPEVAWYIPEVSYHALYKSTKQPDYLLHTVTEPTGAVTTLEYTEAHQYYDGEDQPLNTALPYAVWTPSTVTVDPGSGGEVQETSYTYEGGAAAWTNPNDREFAGFWKVTATSGDTKTITEFHQGIGGLPMTTSTQLHADRGQYADESAKRGRAYRTEVRDANTDDLVQAIVTKWDSDSLDGEGRKFVYPSRTTSFVANSTGVDATALERAFDSDTGNELSTFSRGSVTADLGTGDISAEIGTDQSLEEKQYATATTGRILGAAKLAQVKTDSQQTIAEKEIRYDGLPLGQVSQGKPTRVEDKLPSSAVYATYDSYANVAASSDPRGATTTFQYDPTYRLVPTASTNPLGQTSLQEVDLATRQVASTTDANGSRERWIRDGFGRPLERWIQNPDAPGVVLAERWTYGDSARPVWVRHESFDSIGDLEPGIDYTYADGLGRVIQTRALEATSTYIISDTLYDTQGRVARQSLPYRGTGSDYVTPASGVPSTTYDYDAAGRVIAVYAPAGNTSVEYDGLVTRITDALGRVAEQERDGQGRLIRVTRWLDSQPVTYTYSWDAASRLTGMADPGGNSREFTYDGQGRLLTQTDWHAPSSTPDTWAYAYDAAGNVTSSTDPRGATINYTYDALNRVVTANDPATAGTDSTYSYDHTGSHGIGRLREATNRGVTSTYDYDRLGRVSLVERNIFGEKFDQSHRYDLVGREVLRVEPDSRAVLTEYDRLGRWSATRLAEGASSSSPVQTVVGSLQFNQPPQYAEASDDTTLDITGQVTIEAWVRYPSVPPANHGYTILAKGVDGPGNWFNYWLYIGEGDHLVFVLRSGSGPGYYAEATTTLGDAGTGWHHYAVTFDDETDTVYFYRDGQQLGGPLTLTAPLVTNDTPVRIGLDAGSNLSVSMVGNLSEVRLWNTARSAAQISTNKDYRLIEVPGLAAAWPLNDLVGPLALDASGNENEARLSATTSPSWSRQGPTLSGIAGPLNPQLVAGAQAYTPLGQPQSVVYGNGLVTRDTYTPEDGYRLARRTTGEEGSYLQDLNYEYDAVGNVIRLLDQSQAEPLGKDITYTYDDLDRLVRSYGTMAYGDSPEASSTFSYDLLGNMRTRGDANLYRLAYVSHPYRASHAVVGGDGFMPFQWDAAGNLIEVGSNLYSYNGFGQLGTSTYWVNDEGFRDTYSYDHAGQRAYRTHDNTDDELDPVATYQLGSYEEDLDKAARLFLDAPGRRLAQVSVGTDGHPAIQYLHPDALGSTPLSTGYAGDPVALVDQEPYGIRTIDKLADGPAGPARSYTGKELDPSSWYYFGARYYDPSSARFTQVDPVSLNLTRPGLEDLTGGYGLRAVLAEPHKLLNPYAYAANNPTKYTDPDGNFIPLLLAVAYVGWQVYDTYATARDVHHAFTDPGATGLDKGLALGFLVLNLTPVDDIADAAKYGSRAVRAGERALARNALKDYSLSPNWRRHVIDGWTRSDGTIVGEHVWSRAVQTEAKQGTISMFDNGVRVHRWTENGKPLVKSYFPDHWTETDIEAAGNYLLRNGQIEGRRIFGEFKGIKLEGQINDTSRTLNSWYPDVNGLR